MVPFLIHVLEAIGVLFAGLLVISLVVHSFVWWNLWRVKRWIESEVKKEQEANK